MAEHETDSGGLAVPLPELLPDDFVRDHTDFPSLGQMVAAGGVKSAADLNSPAWNSFVAAHSRFDGWPALIQAGAEAYARRQIAADDTQRKQP